MSEQVKKVSIPLAIGIFIAPLIFAWVTLKKEYSNKAKIISFSWLLLGGVAFFMLPDQPVQSQQIEKIVQKTPEYKIINDEIDRDKKRLVEVLVDGRLTEQQIKLISDDIQMKNKSIPKTYVQFYLGDKKTAWAIAEYVPEYSLRMIGSTVQEHEKLQKTQPKINGELLGQWSANWGYESKVIFEKKDNKIFMREVYSDGEGKPTELAISEKDGNTVYETEAGKSHGEYYVINSSGDLEYWSKNGNYYTAKK